MTTFTLSDCEHVMRATIVTTMADGLTFAYCKKGTCTMAASTSKTILFAKASHNKQTHQWPVAVFNDAKGAKHYVSFLRLARKAGNHDMLSTLDPAAPKVEGYNLSANAIYSLATVPYAPTPAVEDDNEPIGEMSSTV